MGPFRHKPQTRFFFKISSSVTKVRCDLNFMRKIRKFLWVVIKKTQTDKWAEGISKDLYLAGLKNILRTVRNHSFSTCTKFFKKLLFLTPYPNPLEGEYQYWKMVSTEKEFSSVKKIKFLKSICTFYIQFN